MSIKSVSDAKGVINVTERESEGGRAGLDQYGRGNFSIACEMQVSFTDRDVAALAGFSAGIRLPKPFRYAGCSGAVVFGTPMSQAAWDALATDDLRDNACVCSDADFPLGSVVDTFHPATKAGVGTSLATLTWHGLPVAEFPYGVIVKCTTAGAAGTAQIACSTDNGATFGTPYATAANAINTIKDSSNADTGLRIRLATQTFVLNDTATIDVAAPGAANRYKKTAPETWTKLN